MIEPLEVRRLLAQSVWAYPGADGKLLYRPLPLGDKIQDFTNVGYMGGTAAIPDVPVRAVVAPVAGDDTASIQAAVDAVEAMTPDAAGLRGAVLLSPGTYEVATTIRINTSGVVLRGSGQGQTILVATGTEKDTLIQLDGNGGRSQVSGSSRAIVDKYVPVGAISFTVSDASGFVVGDTVIVERKATANWIHDLGMDLLENPWTGRDVDMDRVITRIDGNVITVDAPVTQAIDQKYGGATVWKYIATGRLANVGVEYITGRSTFDPAILSGSDRVDENHAEHFIGVDGVINGWVRNVTSEYFGYSCVNMTGPSKWVTVQDSQCLDPVSVVTGGRRYSFNMGDSVGVLWKNLYTRDGRHDYVQGSEVTGPNVVVDSRADKARSDTGPHHRYSTGTLWDNVDVNGHSINIQNRGNSGSGHGWAGANQVVWNSEANSFTIQNPPTAWNWAIGNIGTIQTGSPGLGTQGIYDSHGTKVDTRSLFHAQMAEKLAHENWMLREVRLGDADNYTAGDVADAASADAAWKASVQNAAGRTGVGFDVVGSNQLVAFTFNFALDPGTYVVGASLSLGLKSAGGSTAADTVHIESTGRTYTWAQLGVAAPGVAASAAVIDLSTLLAGLQDGRLNIAISGNTAVDWATLNFQTASTTQPATTSLTPTDDAYVDAAIPAGNFGTATSVQTKLNGAADQRETYLKFDVSGLAGEVTSAFIRLTPTAVGYNATTFGSGIGAMSNRVSPVSGDAWTQSTINWINRPAADPFFREFLSYLNEPVIVDVTSFVRSARAGDGKLSLRISGATSDDNSLITFASLEHPNAALRPQLLVRTYEAVLPVADATVRGGSSADLNFGSDEDLAVKRDTSATSGNNREAYLRFDLTSVSAAPAGATLRLMPVAAGAPQARVTADFVSSDSWTETGITWNSKPAGSGVLGSSHAWQAAPLKFNVDSQVASAIAGDDLLSIRLYSNIVSAGVNQFASRQWLEPWLRPMLVLKNLAPMITSVPNVTGRPGTATSAMWFGVWDAETELGSLAVTAASSNPALLPAGNILLGGAGADRTLTLTPAPGQFGTSTVTLTVSDAQGRTATTSFLFTVPNVVTVDGDQESPGQGDVFRIVRNGAFIDVIRNGAVAIHADFNSGASYVIRGLGGDDQVLVDLSGGLPIPAGGIQLDGGAGTDTIQLIGSPGAETVTLSAGDVVISGNAVTLVPGSNETLHLQLGAGGDTLIAGGNASVNVAEVRLDVSGGTLSLGVGSTLPGITNVTVAAGGTLDLGGQNQTIDALNGTGTVTNNGGAATLTVGLANGSGTFAGTLRNGTGTLALSKVGTGTQTLSGANSFSGVVTLHAGTLASGNPASLAATSNQVMFNGGTLRITADTASANVANKYATNTGFAGSGGTIEVDAGVTFTIGTLGGSASLRTAGGGFSGGPFTKTGLGTLRVLSDNGQLDDPVLLAEGTIIAESARALGGADNTDNYVDMRSGTVLVLRADTATNFLTPIVAADPGGMIHVIVDRRTPGPGVVHSINSLRSPSHATITLSAGTQVTSGTAALLLGSMTVGGTATVNVGTGAALSVAGAVSGAGGLSKAGAGSFSLLGSTNGYSGSTVVQDGTFLLYGSLTSSPTITVTGGLLRIMSGQVVRTGMLTVSGAGRLDLTNASMLVDYSGPTPIDTLRSYLRDGYAGGTWDGPGIVSSTAATTLQGAVGYAEATDLGMTWFAGQLVDQTAVLLRFAKAGDANLDDHIGADDTALSDRGRALGGRTWVFGDFNYDGSVNDADSTNFQSALLAAGGPQPVAVGAASGNVRAPDPVPVTSPARKQTTKPDAAGKKTQRRPTGPKHPHRSPAKQTERPTPTPLRELLRLQLHALTRMLRR